MDDLESNPLYKTFLTKSKREFDIACKMSYLIAIPHSDSIDNVMIDQFFANSHILMPSKLLKMHYTPLQAGQIEDIEEIECNKLIVYVGKKKPAATIVVNILAQEIGYNVYNKEFRTILIDRPLIPPNSTRTFIGSIFLSPLYSSSPNIVYNNSNNFSKRIKPPKPILNHDDCIKYLEFISQDVTVQLENDVKKLQSKYLFLSNYLDDAALRIKSLAELYSPKYECQLLQKYNITNNNNNNDFFYSNNNNSNNNSSTSNSMLCDSSKKSISLALENYIVHLLHGKLLTSLYQCHEKEDKILLKKFQLIKKYQLTICQLGAQEAFSDFCVTEDILQEFRRLPSLQSPLAMVSSLMKIVQLITESLNQSVKFKNMIGGGSSSSANSSEQQDMLFCDFDSSNQNLNSSSLTLSQEQQQYYSYSESKVTICSDDLIASFVYSLAQSQPPNLFSTSKYLELFGFSSNAKEQAAYYTATFQIVIQYIFSFDPENQELQQQKEHQRKICSRDKNNPNQFIDNGRMSTGDGLVYQTKGEETSNEEENMKINISMDDNDDDDEFIEIYAINRNGTMPLQKSQSLFVMNSLESRESASTE